MEFYARVINKRLVAENNSDYEKIGKIRENHPYRFTISTPRNYEFLKKFFALINLTFDNQEQFNNIEDMREEIIIASGFYVKTTDLQGNEKKKAKSISFASMDETEFSELYSKVLDQVCNWLEISDEDIKEQIINYF